MKLTQHGFLAMIHRMNSLSRKPLVFFTLLVSLLLPAAASAQEPLLMGVFPRRDAGETLKLYKPMADYLSAELGRPVWLEVPKDFPGFWKAAETGRYDIIHCNQYHYVKAHKEFGYDAILMNEEYGESTIAGSLIVRKDSKLTSVRDLKGKKIIFGGGPMAMQSHIFARYVLQAAGLVAGVDYTFEFADNPPAGIIAVHEGKAAAAGAGDKVLLLPTVARKIKVSEMAYLARGAQLPHLPWAVKKTMPAEERTRIQNLLADMYNNHKGREILRKAKLTGLVPAKDSDYDAHRRIIHKVLAEQY